MPQRDQAPPKNLAKRRLGIIWLMIAGCTFLAMNAWLILHGLVPMR